MTHEIIRLEWLSSRLAVVFAQTIEASHKVENEDVVGAAPTGDAPSTSEWSTILLPTKVRLILEVWRYISGVSVPLGSSNMEIDVQFHSKILDNKIQFW